MEGTGGSSMNWAPYLCSNHGKDDEAYPLMPIDLTIERKYLSLPVPLHDPTLLQRLRGQGKKRRAHHPKVRSTTHGNEDVT
jgi:hypothetical protein